MKNYILDLLKGKTECRIQGSVNYLQVLKIIHEEFKPNNYLEIGVCNGESLSLAQGNAVGIDPISEITANLQEKTRILQITSNEFFEQASDPILKQEIDLVFINGNRLFEYVLHDFMNVEEYSHSNTVVVVDDIIPNKVEQEPRQKNTRFWTGDIWIFYVYLKKHRPDLCFISFDTVPTGLLLITGLNNKNTFRSERYSSIVCEIHASLDKPSRSILDRKKIICSKSKKFQRCLEVIKNVNNKKELMDVVYLNKKPKLSIVVICFNMKRELPRTLKSLSPTMQIGLTEEEYEVIVVDNGSLIPFDLELCQSICSNIRFFDSESNSKSPVKAINKGIKEAKADLVGVMIDGARMASPGLLITAFEAAKRDPYTVVGTLAFHLGDKVQMESVKNGYNQIIEDQLLLTIPWQENGYKLFDISVYSASSAHGWFVMPSETNAFFMRKNLWIELGGFDEEFQEAGGGLVNLDTWYRACNHPKSKVMILLGEATFHQFHGGIATNNIKPTWETFANEYRLIRNKEYQPPNVPITHFGNKHPKLGEIINNSVVERISHKK